MDVKEFRTGNLLNYTTAEGDILTSALDWQDFKWLEENRKGFELVHDYIPLTEQWLLDFGFEYNVEDDAYQGNRLHIEVRNNDPYLTNDSKKLLRDCFGVWLLCTDSFLLDIKYVHQLQNLYYSLTGEELIKK